MQTLYALTKANQLIDLIAEDGRSIALVNPALKVIDFFLNQVKALVNPALKVIDFFLNQVKTLVILPVNEAVDVGNVSGLSLALTLVFIKTTFILCFYSLSFTNSNLYPDTYSLLPMRLERTAPRGQWMFSSLRASATESNILLSEGFFLVGLLVTLTAIPR